MNDFEALCFCIWGKHWKVEAAEYLGKDKKNIYQYKKGIIKPKEELLRKLYDRLLEQRFVLDSAIARFSKYDVWRVDRVNSD